MLKDLRMMNRARADLWRQGQAPAGPLFAAVELAGECGELCNLVKKRERQVRGYGGGSVDLSAIRDELADVVICADLLADALGVDLCDAIVSKFNRDSDKRGFPQRLVVDERDAEIERLRARVAELEKPTGFWCDVNDHEWTYPSVQEAAVERIEQGGSIGDAVEAIPIHAMSKVYYGIVPVEDCYAGDWDDADSDAYDGEIDVVGPFDTEQEAMAEAVRVTAERRDAAIDRYQAENPDAVGGEL